MVLDCGSCPTEKLEAGHDFRTSQVDVFAFVRPVSEGASNETSYRRVVNQSVNRAKFGQEVKPETLFVDANHELTSFLVCSKLSFVWPLLGNCVQHLHGLARACVRVHCFPFGLQFKTRQKLNGGSGDFFVGLASAWRSIVGHSDRNGVSWSVFGFVLRLVWFGLRWPNCYCDKSQAECYQ